MALAYQCVMLELLNQEQNSIQNGYFLLLFSTSFPDNTLILYLEFYHLSVSVIAINRRQEQKITGSGNVSCSGRDYLLSCGFQKRRENPNNDNQTSVYPVDDMTCTCQDETGINCIAWCSSKLTGEQRVQHSSGPLQLVISKHLSTLMAKDTDSLKCLFDFLLESFKQVQVNKN